MTCAFCNSKLWPAFLECESRAVLGSERVCDNQDTNVPNLLSCHAPFVQTVITQIHLN